MDLNSESALRKALTKLIESKGGHVSNIESHVTSAGVPDMNFFLSGADVWVELKAVGSRGQIKMRPTQRKWHRDRDSVGGISHVVVLEIETGDILLVPGATAAGLDSRIQSWREVAEVRNIHSNGLWAIVRRMVYATKTANQPKPDRDRSAKEAGSPGSALQPSGKDVGGHHWLLDKS